MALTYHYDPRDNDFLFEAYANPPTNKCEDADPVETWRDEVNTDILYRTAANRPTWRQTGSPFPLPSVEFNGSTQNLQHWTPTLSDNKRLSAWVSSTAFNLMMAIYVETTSLNDANPYANHTLITDGIRFGLFVKVVTGQSKLVLVHNDNNDDSVEVNISLNTRYVVMARHDSGTIYLSVNGGAETSTASGTTPDLTSPMQVGGSIGFLDGFIGQIKCWNTGNADGNQASELSTMITDWAPPPVVGFLSWGEASRPIITKVQTPMTI